MINFTLDFTTELMNFSPEYLHSRVASLTVDWMPAKFYCATPELISLAGGFCPNASEQKIVLALNKV